MIREWMGFSGRIVLGGGVETPGYVVRVPFCVVKNSGCGLVGVHLGENTKERCDWWVLGEVRILAITGLFLFSER